MDKKRGLDFSPLETGIVVLEMMLLTTGIIFNMRLRTQVSKSDATVPGQIVSPPSFYGAGAPTVTGSGNRYGDEIVQEKSEIIEW